MVSKASQDTHAHESSVIEQLPGKQWVARSSPARVLRFPSLLIFYGYRRIRECVFGRTCPSKIQEFPDIGFWSPGFFHLRCDSSETDRKMLDTSRKKKTNVTWDVGWCLLCTRCNRRLVAQQRKLRAWKTQKPIPPDSCSVWEYSSL